MKRCEHERLETGYMIANKLVCLDCNSEWEWQPLKKRYVKTVFSEQEDKNANK